MINQVSAVIAGSIMYLADGSSMRKSAGGTYYKWGVPIPPAKGSAAEGGAGSLAAGTYRLVIVPVSFLGKKGNPWETDSDTDPISVTVAANKAIDVTIPIHGDPQVKYMMVYRTKVDEVAPYYYAGMVDNGTTSLSLNGGDDSLPTTDTLEAALPDSTTGAPPFIYARPPAKTLCDILGGVIFCAGERSYSDGLVSATDGSSFISGTGVAFTSEMAGKTIQLKGESVKYVIESIVSETVLKTSVAYSTPPWRGSDPSSVEYQIIGDGNEVCPSEPDEPEYFNPLRRFSVGEAEGGTIRGMMQYGGDMMMLTESNVYRVSPTYESGVFGVLTTNSKYGTPAPRSLVRAGGGLVFFSGEHLCMYANSDASPFSDSRMGDLFKKAPREMKQYAISAMVGERLYFAFSASSTDHLDRIAVYDFNGGTWDLWSGFRIIDMVSVVDSSGRRYLQIEVPVGDKYGIFRFDEASLNDGFGTQDYSGSVVVGTTSTITVDATLPTANLGVRGAAVRVYDASGDEQTRYVLSNTASTITIEGTWASIPDSTYTYTVGQINEFMESGRLTFGDPFIEKSVKNIEISSGER